MAITVCILGNAKSIHIIKWANSISSRGCNVTIISQHRRILSDHRLEASVSVRYLPLGNVLGYLFNVFFVRRLLKDIFPDIVNAHYASGYGLLARLSGFKPLLLSVWGSDVYDFPRKSKLHRWLLNRNIKAATAIASTSHAMASELSKIYCHHHVFITPFGVDEKVFFPDADAVLNRPILIGTVKSLYWKYGVDTLIEAFATAVNKLNGSVPIQLQITGGGPDRKKLQELSMKLGVADLVEFKGPVSHSDVPKILNQLDIYVALSRFESFGVAIIEASACAKAVVVSDADGPAEVTIDGKTGLIVKKNNSDMASDALVELVLNRSTREKMGIAGRDHIRRNYTWEHSVDVMLDVYEQTISIDAIKRR